MLKIDAMILRFTAPLLSRAAPQQPALTALYTPATKAARHICANLERFLFVSAA